MERRKIAMTEKDLTLCEVEPSALCVINGGSPYIPLPPPVAFDALVKEASLSEWPLYQPPRVLTRTG